MEKLPSYTPYKVDTMLVPQDVNIQLASERNKLIEAWRAGLTSAHDTQYELLKLYWTTQQQSNDETRIYLMDGSMDFAQEAEIDPEVDGDIWIKAQQDFC